MANPADVILAQGRALAIKYPTVDELSGFVTTNTVNQQNAHVMAAFAGFAQDAVPAHTNPWEKWADKIKHAVCTDFNYCGKKAEVQADLNKFLPDIIKALINNKVGQNGPSWITSILVALGFMAGWEAAVATIVAYLIIKGLDIWCACPA